MPGFVVIPECHCQQIGLCSEGGSLRGDSKGLVVATPSRQSPRHDIDHSKDAARRFKEMEFVAIVNMAAQRGDEKNYISATQQNLRNLESLMDNAPIMKANQNMD